MNNRENFVQFMKQIVMPNKSKHFAASRLHINIFEPVY